MVISVAEEDVSQYLDQLLALLNRNREHKVGKDRFKWLYLDNPQGLAKVWIVQDEATRKLVAFTSVLPRLVKVSGKNVLCWNCCDFSVDKK